MPTGRPSSSARPDGIEIPGTPARFAGMVVTSLRYICIGSSIFSPSLNAVVGAVGVAITTVVFYGAHRIRSPMEPVVVVLAAIALTSIAGKRLEPTANSAT